jgi:hypothetical protein
MAISKIIHRTTNWIRSLGHLGRLGKVAATRSFLLREKNKLLLKLGEKSFLLMREKNVNSPELSRLMEQIDKINLLLSRQDYGGKEGVDFTPSSKERRKKGKKK